MSRAFCVFVARVAIACGLALAACASPQAPAAPSGGAPTTTAEPSTAAAATAAPVPTSAPAAAGPAATSAPLAGSTAASGNPIKIGLLEALTGPIASVGKDNRDGFNLYLSTLDNMVAGHPVQVIVADTTGQPDVAAAKVQDLVENQKVDILAGINQTPECYVVAQYVQKAQVPLVVSGNCGATYLTIDPNYASPYLVRASSNSGAQAIVGDWIANKGYKKAVMFTADYVGGLELNDLIAGAIVKHGGSIVQELHAPVGTTDFGPYLAQLDTDADVVVAFEPGADGLRFGQQYAQYVGPNSKLQVIDVLSQIAGGSNLAQMKDSALGIIGASTYTNALDTPAAKSFAQAMANKYPGRALSGDQAIGWAGAQIITAALQQVNGNVQDKQAFMNALYATNLDTPRGPVTFDQFHDIISSVYMYQIVRTPNGYDQKLLDRVDGAGQLTVYTPEQLKAANFGKLKGQWFGMTKDRLDQALLGTGF
jgi:branched-chain amino acid transport system substrate-binding protein